MTLASLKERPAYRALLCCLAVQATLSACVTPGARAPLEPPPPPCTEASQYERARRMVAPDFVSMPRPLVMPVPPAPPRDERPTTLLITFRVDSVGSFNPDSIVVTGGRTASYRIIAKRYYANARFHPAVLFPDVCAVPATTFITVSLR